MLWRYPAEVLTSLPKAHSLLALTLLLFLDILPLTENAKIGNSSVK
jgi:hypothetical protein